ncbi:MAG TPA: hypothetical protein PKC83_09375 [Gemmatimonadaceae bacterium]|nr:hypothetical protein [Gemmatimonadaceae bacterium]
MKPRLALRLLAVPLLAAYAARRLANADYWDLLDDVDLAIHEAGHVIFQPFGDHGMTAGGSLFQLLVPLAFVAYFVTRRDRFAASVVLAWVAVNLLNVASYIGDARAQELPLLGGENAVHDWWYLLTEWDALGRDREIARGVRMVGALAWVVAVGGAFAFARGGEPIAGEAREAREAPETPRAPFAG